MTHFLKREKDHIVQTNVPNIYIYWLTWIIGVCSQCHLQCYSDGEAEGD